MAVVDGSACSDDSSYEIVNYDEEVEVIAYDDDHHHKDCLWNNGDQEIVDSFVKVDYDSKSLVMNLTKSFYTSNVINTLDDSDGESKQAHEEKETKTEEELPMEATRCSHSRPDDQVISSLNKAEQKEKIIEGASDSDDNSNDIMSCFINGIVDLLEDENKINTVIAATVVFGLLFSFSNFEMLVYLGSLLLVLAINFYFKK